MFSVMEKFNNYNKPTKDNTMLIRQQNIYIYIYLYLYIYEFKLLLFAYMCFVTFI